MKNSAPIAALIAAGIALSGCSYIEEGIAEATADTYYATLTGAQEVGPGDPDGTARAEISISDELGQICYDINNVRAIGPVTAAHIHEGAAGTNGPPVFTLTANGNRNYVGCDDAPQALQDRIARTPTQFYINLHTAEFPQGAIRGQLGFDN